MEVKIGVQSVPRELHIETNSSPEEIERALVSAIADEGVLKLIDDKGGKVFVPIGKLAYIEIGGPEPRRVGFGAL